MKYQISTQNGGWWKEHQPQAKGDDIPTENVSLKKAQSDYMKNPGAKMSFFKNGTSNNENITGLKLTTKAEAAKVGAKVNQKPLNKYCQNENNTKFCIYNVGIV